MRVKKSGAISKSREVLQVEARTLDSVCKQLNWLVARSLDALANEPCAGAEFPSDTCTAVVEGVRRSASRKARQTVAQEGAQPGIEVELCTLLLALQDLVSHYSRNVERATLERLQIRRGRPRRQGIVGPSLLGEPVEILSADYLDRLTKRGKHLRGKHLRGDPDVAAFEELEAIRGELAERSSAAPTLAAVVGVYIDRHGAPYRERAKQINSLRARYQRGKKKATRLR